MRILIATLFELMVESPSVIPTDFITPASFMSMIGLSGITYVVSNTAQQAFNFNPRWFALVVAIVATEVGVSLTKTNDPILYIIGALNGCLVFLTAAGASAAAGRRTNQANPQNLGSSERGAIKSRRFRDPWF